MTDKPKRTLAELIAARDKQEAAYQESKAAAVADKKAELAESAADSVRSPTVNIVFLGTTAEGSWTLQTTNGPQPVYRNHVYQVTRQVYNNLLANYPGWWWKSVG